MYNRQKAELASVRRIERLRQNYINTKPSICYERARIFTESHQRTEGQPVSIRRAQAFYDFCDQFDKRPQDPYEMTAEQRSYVREHIFPYWRNQSLKEFFLAQLPEESAKLVIDTGIIDNDSKWRQAVGEITPDYQDILFVKGFSGIRKEAEEQLKRLNYAAPEDLEKITFYQSII